MVMVIMMMRRKPKHRSTSLAPLFELQLGRKPGETLMIISMIIYKIILVILNLINADGAITRLVGNNRVYRWYGSSNIHIPSTLYHYLPDQSGIGKGWG